MHIGVVTLNVHDQERAKKFYAEKLGWEVRTDAPMGEDARWVTVAPKGGQTELVLAQGFGDWSADKVGGHTGIVIEVDNIYDTGNELRNAGVEFTVEPSEEFFGGWAVIKDSEGNELGLHSPAEVPAGT